MMGIGTTFIIVQSPNVGKTYYSTIIRFCTGNYIANHKPPTLKP